MVAEDHPRASRAVYWTESVLVIRQRFSLAMGIFVVFMGVGAFVEGQYYPPRATQAWLLWGLESLVGLLGAGACWLPILRSWVRPIAAAAATAVIALICTYHGGVGASAERLATVLGCMLNLLAVVVPWATRAQAFVALGTLASFAVAAPHLVATESMSFPGVVLAAAATTAVWAALFLDRYRFEAFRRTALQTEEAEIAAALAHVGETLSRSLGQADVLEQVNRLAVAALCCDFSSLLLFDERRGVYRHASTAGGRAEVVAELPGLEFAPASMPFFASFRPGELIEIADPAAQDLVPPAFMERLQIASVLCAPVSLGDRVIGALVSGYNVRTGSFSIRQRRLALGIAHSAAIALENTRLVADLQAANRLKSEFVATMSHELRTPLNVIMGYTQMLADGAVGPEDPGGFAKTLDRIQRNAVELFELVSATLDMGRLEAGREAVTLGPVDLGELFGEIAREVEPIVPDCVALAWRNELGQAPVVSDRLKLKTVLKNLVGNALKFTSAGAVRVVARQTASGIVIAVHDSGVGIAPQHLALVFEMFRQVDSSSTRRHGGVGLGLHIARRLVELLGGTIAVESTVGVGSTFVVTLPVRASPALAVSATAA